MRGIINRVIPISSCSPHARNYNRHSEQQIGDLRESLKQFGQVRSIVVQKASKGVTLVAGHGIWEAAKLEGFKELRADVIPSSWSKHKVLAYLAADNELGRHADPDQAQLDAIVKELWDADQKELARIAAGEQAALDRILSEATEKKQEPVDPDDLVDRAADLNKKWKCALGQLWEIPSASVRGKCHRLLCGDSTDAATVERLMGKEKAALFETDPPYGIDYDSAELHRNETHFDAIHQDDLKNEQYQEWLEGAFRVWAKVLRPDAAWYLWHPMLTQGYFAAAAAAAAGVIISRQIIWRKPQFIFGRGDYHWMHELCFYGWVKGHKPKFYGERNQTTVWEIGYDGQRNKRDHPTAKPPALWYAPMGNHTKVGDVCAEPFSGSGSQYVAGETLGRLVYGCELEPKYCAVALERLSNLGLSPHLEKAKHGK